VAGDGDDGSVQDLHDTVATRPRALYEQATA
jgi:hypothetical protein